MIDIMPFEVHTQVLNVLEWSINNCEPEHLMQPTFYDFDLDQWYSLYELSQIFYN